jgi:hypothetical protein
MMQKLDKVNDLTAAFSAGALTGFLAVAAPKLTSVFLNATHNTQTGDWVTTTCALAVPVMSAGFIGYNWKSMRAENRGAALGAMGAMLTANQVIGAYEPIARLIF